MIAETYSSNSKQIISITFRYSSSHPNPVRTHLFRSPSREWARKRRWGLICLFLRLSETQSSRRPHQKILIVRKYTSLTKIIHFKCIVKSIFGKQSSFCYQILDIWRVLLGAPVWKSHWTNLLFHVLVSVRRSLHYYCRCHTSFTVNTCRRMTINFFLYGATWRGRSGKLVGPKNEINVRTKLECPDSPT